MGKPRMIILIRHAQSEGNKNREIHQTVPDHRVKLTPEGHKQALEAGRKLRALLRPDDTIHFFTSPYRRTRETTEGILTSLTSDDPSPSPFPRQTIKVYEEPRLREQDFGNFQPCSAEMERMWQERADYGHFFYRIPNGESAADAYDRVSGFNESLWRLFGEDDFASVCVLVTHGLMTRVFLMKWYHFSVEYFEDLRNINHCEFVVMEKNKDNGKYILQNNLRTWSDLKRERELEKKRERAAKGIPELSTTTAGTTSAPSETSVPTRRKWGGCPDGCDHGLVTRLRASRRPTRKDTSDVFRDDDEGDSSAAEVRKASLTQEPLSPTAAGTYSHQTLARSQATDSSQKGHKSDTVGRNGAPSVASNPQISITALVDQSEATCNLSWTAGPGQVEEYTSKRSDNTGLTSDDDATESLMVDKLLRLGGRDGGGSKSGVNSLEPSDEEQSDKQKNVTQNVEEDGDDESLRVKTRSRRPKHRSHNHLRLGLSPLTSSYTNQSAQPLAGLSSPRRADILGDGHAEEDGDADMSVPETSEGLSPLSPPTEPTSTTTRDSLDEDRKHDQSVMGSVY